MNTPDTDCSLAHGMSTGYPRNADWRQVTKWSHLVAAIGFAVTRPETTLSDSQFEQYKRLKK